MTYNKTKALQKLIDASWTSQDLSEKYNVTIMTVSLWRRHYKLPAIRIGQGGRSIYYYVPSDVLYWEKHDKPSAIPRHVK